MSQSNKRRCICGKSSTLPVCDFSHKSENWECASDVGSVFPWCFVAGPHNLNLAEKLAAELNGVTAHTTSNNIIATKEVVLTEGTDLESVMVLDARVSAQEKIVIGLNVDPDLLRPVFADAQVVSVSGETLELWQQIRNMCRDSDFATCTSQSREFKSAFLSHAVADELIIQKPLEYLRRFFNADIFACADSIASGSDWQSQIVDNLDEKDLFVLLLSKSAIQSTFCAFEIGYATAMKKEIAIVSIDGSSPPSFIQHIQMSDVARLIQRNPWLETEEALLETLLQLL